MKIRVFSLSTGCCCVFLLAAGLVHAQTGSRLAPTGLAVGDNFGISVSASADRLVVGASGAGSGQNKGKVFVFERLDGNWDLAATLVASDGEPGDQFGHAVSTSGDRVAVGAPGDDDGGYASGSAYIFGRGQGEGGNQWRQVTKLLASKPAPTRQFGQSISIGADRLVVGQQLDDDSGRSPGSAYIFELDPGGTGQWAEVATVSAHDATRSNAFGSVVAISGDLVVAGAFGDQDGGLGTGSAYVFKRDQGDKPWDNVVKLRADDTAARDNFGSSLAVSGNRVVIGSPFDDDTADGSGSVYIFEQDQGGDGKWVQAAKLTANDPAALDNFGRSVSISGNCVAVGAPQEDDGANNSGAVYVFARQSTETHSWGLVTKLKIPDAAAGDSFGASVSIGRGFIVAGAPFADGAGNNAGSVYVEELAGPAGLLCR